MQTSTTRRPQWLARPTVRRKNGAAPTAEFDRGLNQWTEGRAHELETPSGRARYGYFGHVCREHLRAMETNLEAADHLRETLLMKHLAPEEWQRITLEERSPARTLAVSAFELGWRVVPHARWASAESGDPTIAFEMEAACRDWAARADAVWDSVARFSDTVANKVSGRAMVAPLLAEAQMLEAQLNHHLGFIGLDLGPWG